MTEGGYLHSVLENPCVIRYWKYLYCFLAAVIISVTALPAFCRASSSDESDSVSQVPGPRSYRVVIGLGGGRYNLGDINKYYIEEFGRTVGLLKDNLHLGLDLHLGLEKYLSATYSLDIGISFLYARSTSVPTNSWPWDHRKSSLVTLLVGPEVNLKHSWPVHRHHLFLSGGLGGYYGEVILGASESPSVSDQDYFARSFGLGVQLSSGMILRLTSSLSLGPELGYRLYRSGDLQNDGDDVRSLNGIRFDRTPRLDFSGPFLIMRLVLDFSE